MAACTLHQHWGMLKGAETLFKLATKAFAVKTTMCNEKALIHVITRSVVRGSFNNYVDHMFPNFDCTYHPSLGQLLIFHQPFVHEYQAWTTYLSFELSTYILNDLLLRGSISCAMVSFMVLKKYNIYPLFYKVDKNWQTVQFFPWT